MMAAPSVGCDPDHHPARAPAPCARRPHPALAVAGFGLATIGFAVPLPPLSLFLLAAIGGFDTSAWSSAAH